VLDTVEKLGRDKKREVHVGINRMELRHAVSTSNLLGYGVMVQHMQDNKCPAAGLAGH